MMKEYPTMVADLIGARIDLMAPRKTQKQPAKEMGFKSANMLSMLRTGDAKVPFSRLSIIAEVLELDPALLLRLHLCEQWLDFENIVFEIFGGMHTKAEREWVDYFGDLGVLVPPRNTESRQKLAEFLDTLDWEER
jgi:hypothetical protein